MASSTQNVHVGPCRVYFDGLDLGLTKGGVDVEVSTETFKTEVDQFGKTPVSEVVTARMVKASVPMAETDLDKLMMVMPGSNLVTVGGAKATGTITIGTNPTAAQTILVNGKTFTFRATYTAPGDVVIGANAGATAANLAAALNASTDPKIALANYTVAASVVTVTYYTHGTEGNAFTLAAGTSAATVSGGGLLAGGAEPTGKRVDVTDGVGINLLNVARELRLHPMDRPDGDQTDDFVIPLAATAGGLKFAYKIEDVRVFSCEFTGYPNAQTRKLFHVGVDT